MIRLSFSVTLILCIIIIVDANNFEEDSFVDDTPETVAKYIVDQLVASVTESVGKCHDLIFILSLCLCLQEMSSLTTDLGLCGIFFFFCVC